MILFHGRCRRTNGLTNGLTKWIGVDRRGLIEIVSRRLKGEFKNPSGKEADMRRVFFLTFFAITAPIALAQDPVNVDAKHYKVMFENDQVRVLKIHYNPKEKSVMTRASTCPRT